jgi:Uma2 family endonuclease
MPLTAIIVNDEVRVPPHVVDLASYRRWAASDEYPERGRISYLAGELDIDMNAENINAHSTVKGCLMIALGMIADRDDLGEVFPDGTLIVNTDADIGVDPDLTFVSHESLNTGRVRMTETPGQEDESYELIGSPDLVVEVISPSSVRKDRKVLRERYFLAVVTEYWLIDARREPLKFDILTRGESGFVEAPADAEGFRPSTVFARRFRLTCERRPTGLKRYRLEEAR